jgi:glycosyltransferase involved in cell wall biosynthesis
MYLVGGFVTWSPWENPEARIINVPFGIPQEPPTVGPANIKHLGLDPYRPLVLWNGGIWDWMDPIVLLRAFRLLKDRDSSLQLLFMASRSCDGSETDAAKRAKDYAVRHDLLGNNVFFGEEWLPYEERVQWLRAATACVVSAPDHLESRFSCRTRLFDAIWARTPIVCTTGGYLAEETVRYSLGRTTAADSPTELAEALEAVVQPEAQELYRRNLEDYASGASWHQRTEVLRSRLAELLAKPSQPRSATVLALEYLRYKIACRLG